VGHGAYGAGRWQQGCHRDKVSILVEGRMAEPRVSVAFVPMGFPTLLTLWGSIGPHHSSMFCGRWSQQLDGLLTLLLLVLVVQSIS
jgi:hypothetical protein